MLPKLFQVSVSSRHTLQGLVQMISGKISSKAKDLVLPRFSEMELITLFFLSILLLIEQRSTVISYLTNEFRARIETSDDLIFLFTLIAVIFLSIIIFLKTIENALRHKVMGYTDKKLFSTLYYSILSVITFSSTMELLSSFTDDLIKFVEFLFIFFTLIRSFCTLTYTYLLKKADLEHVYASRMTDEQISISELLLILVSSPILFIWLRYTHTIITTLSLSYFYIITLVMFFRVLINNPIVVRVLNRTHFK